MENMEKLIEENLVAIIHNFNDEKNKILVKNFIEKLKEDKLIYYDKQNKCWAVTTAYYGHLFTDYYFNKVNNKTNEIDYKKQVIFKNDKTLIDDLPSINEFVKKNIKNDLDDIVSMDIFYEVGETKDESKHNKNKITNDGKLNWFYYHNIICEKKFNILVNNLDYPGFNFDVKIKDGNYIDEMIVEPIEKNNGSKDFKFGYRVYCKMKSGSKKESYSINEIYYDGNPYDNSREEFLTKQKSREQWMKIWRENGVGLVKLTQNFRDDSKSPVLTGRGYLRNWLNENNLKIELNKNEKSKVMERER